MKKNILKPILLVSFLALPEVFLATADAQSQTASTPLKADSLSPAARRAAIRDSLRRARLQRTAPPASVLPKTDTPTSKTTSSTTAPVASSAQNAPSPSPQATAAATPETTATAALPSTPPPLPISDTLLVKSLNVRGAEVRDVLQGLATQFGVSILMAPDVAGPVTLNLTKIKLKDALHLIADQNGFELSAKDGAILVSKRPPPKPPEPPAPHFNVTYDNGKLSADLDKIPVEQVVRKLVQASGYNVVFEPGVEGTMTAFFKDVEWSKALKLLADGAGLEIRNKDGIWSFSPGWASNSGTAGKGGGYAGLHINVKDSMVTIEANQTPLSQIVTALGNDAGISTVIYGEIKGTATMRISGVPLDEAFEILLHGTEYTFWTQNGIYFIGPPSLQGVNNSRLIVLKHMKVDDVTDLLPASLTKDAQIKVVKSQNAIMVLGSYEVLEGISQYIAKIDRPVAQILIEALVVDVNMDRARQYGINFFLGDFNTVPSTGHIYPDIDQVFNKQRSQQILSGIPGLRDIVSLPKDFVAQIQALEQENIVKVRSRPQIATLNGSEASITVGQTQYFLLKQETNFNATGGVTTQTSEHFEKIEANVTLTVTPYVTGEGEITCDIVPDFSEPEGSFNSTTPPTLNRRQLHSKVRLRDGETIVLGGLIKESVNRVTHQVPFLGSIPGLGWLFKNNTEDVTRSQLIIFVTPHVYYGKDANVNTEDYIKKNSDLGQ